MRHSPFTAVYDACVLYPAPLRDFLIWLGLSGRFRARWSAQIHDEWKRNLLLNRRDLVPEQLDRTSALMDRAIPDGLVTGHETLISGLNLPDPDDRHVLNHRPDEALRDLALGIAHNAVNQPLNNDMQRILDNTREQLHGNAVSTGLNDLSGKPKAPVRNIFLRTLLICH